MDGPLDATVLIVGAGIAGLACAERLRNQGLTDVIVLEAQGRLGGRIRTVITSQGPVDEGATWIHGVKGNPIYELIKTIDIPTVVSHPSDQVIFTHSGQLIDKRRSDQVWEMYERFEKYVEQFQDDGERDQSVRTVFDSFLREKRLGHGDAALLRAAVSSAIEQEYAADLEQLSAFWYDNDDENFRGLDAILAGEQGYSALVNHLAQGLDVRLGCEVVGITSQGDSAQVTLADGTVMRCRRVVCTLPLGVLKARHASLFQPPLPASKVRALEGLEMGLLNKCILVFSKAFWSHVHHEWLLHLPPSSPSLDPAAATMREMGFTEFYNLAHTTGKPVLVAFSAGSHAHEMEKLGDAQVVRQALEVLRAMFPQADVPEPLESHVTRWGSDKFSCGSYSYARFPGATKRAREVLAAPHGNVLFAGEATSQKSPSTVHGAYLSGLREADGLLQTLGPGGNIRHT